MEKMIADNVPLDESDKETAELIMRAIAAYQGDLEMECLRERLAALAHERWASWMRYLFSKSDSLSDGSVVIPAALVARWLRQMNTAYCDLPENEKDSDRAEADQVTNIVIMFTPQTHEEQSLDNPGEMW